MEFIKAIFTITFTENDFSDDAYYKRADVRTPEDMAWALMDDFAGVPPDARGAGYAFQDASMEQIDSIDAVQNADGSYTANVRAEVLGDIDRHMSDIDNWNANATSIYLCDVFDDYDAEVFIY